MQHTKMPEGLKPPSASSHTPGHHFRASTDLSNFPAFNSPLSGRGHRPASMVFDNNTPQKEKASPEAVVFDKWLEDLQHYENTLENMASASLDRNFKEELGAIEQWFRVLSEAERTAALYSLLQQTNQVQIRFLIMVLQQMARNDPMSAVLSPANFNKDAMSQYMDSAMSLNSRMPQSPSFYRPNQSPLMSNTISAMFPDAAAALAQQRANINAQRSVHNIKSPIGPIDRSTGASMKESPLAWTPSFKKPTEFPARPKSAEPPTSAQSLPARSIATPLKSPRDGSDALFSPFGETGSGSWASMTNTPAVAMFSQSSTGGNPDLMHNLGVKLAQTKLSNAIGNGSNLKYDFSQMVGSPRIVLDNDVRKFQKKGRSPQPQPSMLDMQASVSSPIMMYDEQGRLMSPQQTSQYVSSHAQRSVTSPRLPTPSSKLLGLNNSGTAWMMSSPQQNNYLYPVSSPVSAIEAGYGSDVSDSRRLRRVVSKPIEDPCDLSLLNDIPTWLRTLRLHKYTDNLKTMRWQDMIMMTDVDLEAKGVNALGARRKLLKSFEQVNEAVVAGSIVL